MFRNRMAAVIVMVGLSVIAMQAGWLSLAPVLAQALPSPTGAEHPSAAPSDPRSSMNKPPATQPGAKDDAPPMLIAELLYENPPVLPVDGLRRGLAAALPHARLTSNDKPNGVMIVFHEDHPVVFKGGEKLPAQTVIIPGGTVDAAEFADALNQTRGWADARQAVARCRYRLALISMMDQPLPPTTRLPLFRAVLQEVVSEAPPVAIYLRHAQRIMDPRQLLPAAQTAPAATAPAAGQAALAKTADEGAPIDEIVLLNVRLFRVENSASSDVIMDSCGLAALGLPDVQMHFHGLDLKQVAHQLYNYASYIYTHGDIIADGDTIEGLEPGQKWRCRHEAAMVAPKRVVIDVDPGEPFTAGRRKP